MKRPSSTLRAPWVLAASWLLAHATAWAGPYSAAANDAANAFDAPVPGFTGPAGAGVTPAEDATNFVNPLFSAWASSVVSYSPAPGVAASWTNTATALGRVTGDNFDVVSLGDAANTNTPAGTITLQFALPIADMPGADFAVFENGLIALFNLGGAGAGGIFGELAFVEVSSDGAHFARFPAISLTASAVGQYGSLEPTGIFNLAGKHANGEGACWGTPFDLAALATNSLVTGGLLDLAAIRYVRLVDIVGNGTVRDSLGNPIHDPWQTIGSGGHDLEAIGAISQTNSFSAWRARTDQAGGAGSDLDGDGLTALQEYAFGRDPRLHDASGAVAGLITNGNLTIEFTRDVRNTDLIYEIEASGDGVHWTVIARSAQGGACAPVAPAAPVITESSADPIRSIGVYRRVRVENPPSAPNPRLGLLRVRVIGPAS